MRSRLWVGKLRQLDSSTVSRPQSSRASRRARPCSRRPYRLGTRVLTRRRRTCHHRQPRRLTAGEEAREQYARFNQMWLDDPWLLPVHTNQRIEVANANVKGYDEHFVTIFEQPNLAKVWLEA